MPGHEKLKTTQIYAPISIRQLKEVHPRTHPARFAVATDGAIVDSSALTRANAELAAETAEEEARKEAELADEAG